MIFLAFFELLSFVVIPVRMFLLHVTGPDYTAAIKSEETHPVQCVIITPKCFKMPYEAQCNYLRDSLVPGEHAIQMLAGHLRLPS